MPNRPSRKKRLRQNEKRRLANKAKKSEAKTLMKRVAQAVQDRNLAAAEEALRKAHSKLDKIAKRNIWHPNNVARKKAKLAKLVEALRRELAGSEA